MKRRLGQQSEAEKKSKTKIAEVKLSAKLKAMGFTDDPKPDPNGYTLEDIKALLVGNQVGQNQY